MKPRSRIAARMAIAIVLVVTAVLSAGVAAVIRHSAPFRLGSAPGLPPEAYQALINSALAGANPRQFRLEVAERIGPYFAVIYELNGTAGAAVLASRGDTWEAALARDTGSLSRRGSEPAGAVVIPAWELEVIVIAIHDPRVARIRVDFPADQASLDMERHGGYSVTYRPAPAASTPFVLQTYDRSGRLLGP